MQPERVENGTGEAKRGRVASEVFSEESRAESSELRAKPDSSARRIERLLIFAACVVVGWFDLPAKTYREIPVDDQCEVLSLLGDIARDDADEPSLHLHAVLGLRDGTTRGGHFISGVVRPTLEVTITETPAELRRRKRQELGIALIDLDA